MKYFSSNEQNNSRSLVLRLAGTILALAVVIYLIWHNWDDFVTSIQQLHYSYILAVLGLAFFSRLMKMLRWFYLLKAIEEEISFWLIFKLSFIGLFTSNILPSTIGGDVVKLAGAIKTGLEPTFITASLIIDRLIGMITMATFLPWGIITSIQIRSTKDDYVFAGGGFIVQTWEKIKFFLIKTWSAVKQWSKFPSSLLVATLLSYLYSLSTFTIVYLILTGLGETISWWTAGGLWVIIYFITLIPISINGLGLQEAALSFVFVSYAGISEPNSLVLAVVVRLVFIISSLPGAFFIPEFFSAMKKNPQKDNAKE